MPRVCTICSDPRLEEIDMALASGRSVPKTAAEFYVPESNLYRHRKDHMTMARSIATSRAGGVVATVERLEALDQDLSALYQKAFRAGHTQAAVAAIAQRIKVVMEISDLRDEVRPKEKRVLNLILTTEEAVRIAGSYTQHQQLTGGSGETKGQKSR